MPIYLYKDGQQYGPYDESVVAEWLKNGQCSHDDLARREGMTEWRKLYTFIDERTPEEILAAVESARAENRDKERKVQEIYSAFDKLKDYWGDKFQHAARTYNNEQIVKKLGYKKLLFANDDPKIIDELNRLLKGVGSEDVVFLFTEVPNEPNKYEVFYKSNSPCFIATAAYGSPIAPEVMVFRRFRDHVLINTKAGALLVELYYRVSPPLASLIARKEWLRVMTRRLFLSPILRLLKAKKFDC